MYPAAFEYHTPTNVKDALGLLGRYKDDAKLLAGGHSLVPMMKLRLAQPKHLIDLRKVPGLSGIKEDGGTIVLGAMTTHWQMESSSLLKSKCAILSETASIIGDPAVRNLGTIGGSIAHADPAADQPATFIALGAEMVCEGAKGRRTVKVDDWFQGLMSTALHEDEILVEIRVPAWPAGTGGAYLKFPHPASRFAVVGVAAMVTLDKEGKCTKVGVGVTGAGTKAVRGKGVEAGVTGKKLDAATIEAAAQKGAEGVDVQADLQGSVEYKAHLCRVFAKRALTEAVKRARA
jgi:aerobic carbon-monoxide dehydrogenase medium subunit